MRTFYLFIIILCFSMISSNVFACEGGGEGGSGSAAATNISSSSTLPPYHVSGNTTRNSSNIWDKIREQAEKHRRDPGKADRDIQKLQSHLNKANTKSRAAQTNKNLEEIIHFLRMRALLGPNPNSLENLNQRIDRIGKKAVAASFIFGIMEMGIGY